MQLQAAIDRLSLDDAAALAKQLDGVVDIVEMGTSLVKDYGYHGMITMRAAVQRSRLLVDLKTIDEGAYEFTQGFQAGADILTVMGASSHATIAAVAAVTQAAQRTMMIDLMETTADKQAAISDFPEAIYCLHHSTDRQDKMAPTATVAAFHQQFPSLKHLAIAGGVDQAGAAALATQGLTDIVIVGSAITKANDPAAAAHDLMEVVHK
ncbi:orotidine 5'-phosphate decarboxylase / HUMPS family protein [Schleiferilactobacillus shenzhenensis]|uniref:SgbH n=1 Tax=Schleiferilactobacillus shenzhenensis LY-73 TaxID=1231336 RepID=U4TT36_9LACO|nr:orotidine 5'-phosphate decarboxylase / HUMPS family protein [Schleiferilactobacillus shenzhenensis]ERL65048.1 SgbH [Schleiferilactobacillus shenzhenensis LY-73]